MSNAIVLADDRERIAQVRELFLEYATSLSFNLCFQSFEKELAELPGDYRSPGGTLLLALSDGQPAGCVALHALEEGVCEMKRLYVRPQFRGSGVGSQLVRQLIESATAMGYQRMRLDTVAEEMQDALRMYQRLGFVEIPPYRDNPMPSALYLELDLNKFKASALYRNAAARANKKKTLGQAG
jgi:ribosomal protein S18 acetylase RimI-like enzyme